MLPDYASWYVIFACNEMALLYTEKSRYFDQINIDSWYKVLEKKEIALGVTDPQKDPMGYRAFMTIQLASLKYNEDLIKTLYQDKQKINKFFVTPDEKVLINIAYYSLAIIHKFKC